MEIIEWKEGMVISEAGIYSGLPMRAYHSTEAFAHKCVSTGGVRKGAVSGYDFWAYSQYNPDSFEIGITRGMRVGQAAHLLVLGDAPFLEEFIPIPSDVLSKSGSRAGNAYKEWSQEQDSKKTWLTPVEMLSAETTAKAIVNNPEAHQVLDGLIEHSIVWQDEETGLWLRCRPDALPVSGIIGDLKCTEADINPRNVTNRIKDGSYHAQMAMIAEGWKAVGGEEIDDDESHVIVFAQMKEPYHVMPVTLNAAWLEHGRRIFRKGVRTIAEGFASGKWEPRVTGFYPLAAPDWMLRENEIAEEAEA